MATSNVYNDSNEPTQELCRFFLLNTCRYGNNCFFSHDPSNGQMSNICQYFLRGKCRYGDQCRNDHTQPKTESNTSFTPFTTIDYLQQNNVNEPISFANINSGPSILYEQPEENSPSHFFQSLCPYAEKDGRCQALETGQCCQYIHGDLCDLCELPVLHPIDEQQRENHRLECLKKYEAECEVAFATQRSQDKKCGVCLETVWEKDGDKRFGILENCDHIFCLNCIRKWRSLPNYEHNVAKACPECRTKSDFVTPTKYWPENAQAKKDLIQQYKDTLGKIHCKLFKRGDGLCPFGSKCFYLHMDKQGRLVQLGPPRRRQRLNADGEFDNYSDRIMFSVFSPFEHENLFNELDFLFDDDDEDEIESHASYPTDDDDYYFLNEQQDSDVDYDDDDNI